MVDVLKIVGSEIKPGQHATVDIPVPHLYPRAEMTMPTHITRGKKDGARLFVCDDIHGDEIAGVEVIRRLLDVKILKRLLENRGAHLN